MKYFQAENMKQAEMFTKLLGKIYIYPEYYDIYHADKCDRENGVTYKDRSLTEIKCFFGVKNIKKNEINTKEELETFINSLSAEESIRLEEFIKSGIRYVPIVPSDREVFLQDVSLYFKNYKN